MALFWFLLSIITWPFAIYSFQSKTWKEVIVEVFLVQPDEFERTGSAVRQSLDFRLISGDAERSNLGVLLFSNRSETDL